MLLPSGKKAEEQLGKIFREKPAGRKRPDWEIQLKGADMEKARIAGLFASAYRKNYFL
jgi:hypothetical protein